MYVSLEKIDPLIQEIFYIQDSDFENKVKVNKIVNSVNCHKGIPMLDWWESNHRFKRYINFSEIFPYLSPPVTFKTRSRSLKSNQLLSLSWWYVYVSLENIHPLIQEISYTQDYGLENGVKVTKTVTYLQLVKMIYSLKPDEHPSICSRNISFLAIKSTFVRWRMTFKMESRSPKHSKLFRLS